MTTKAQREVLLQGKDPVANAIIAHLVAQGWSNDYILKNVASKKYLPHTAVVRVELDSENEMYYVHGEYTSCGQNVLSIYTAYIKAACTPEQRKAAMEKFLLDVEKAINNSFAVRHLGPQAQAHAHA
jgi:hypothetical protein